MLEAPSVRFSLRGLCAVINNGLFGMWAAQDDGCSGSNLGPMFAEGSPIELGEDNLPDLIACVRLRLDDRFLAVEGKAEGQAGGQEGQAVLSARQIAMLQACLDAPVAAEVLMAAAGHVSRTGQFRRYLQRLLDDGLQELTVPGKPRSPAQKYRLTEKGRGVLGRAHEDHQGEGA